MISDEELNKIEYASPLLGETPHQVVKQLVAEVRRLKHGIKNHEDGTAKRELAIANLTSQVNELKRQKERMDERFMAAFNLPPELQEKIKAHKLAYGKAMVKMTWTAKYGRVEYEIMEPEGA